MDHAQEHVSQREALRLLLWDLEWHSYKEMPRVAGVRYSARLLELKRLGYQIEDDNAEEGRCWRLMTHKLGPMQEKKVKVFLREEDVEDLIQHALCSPDAQRALKDGLGSFRANRNKL